MALLSRISTIKVLQINTTFKRHFVALPTKRVKNELKVKKQQPNEEEGLNFPDDMDFDSGPKSDQDMLDFYKEMAKMDPEVKKFG